MMKKHLILMSLITTITVSCFCIVCKLNMEEQNSINHMETSQKPENRPHLSTNIRKINQTIYFGDGGYLDAFSLKTKKRIWRYKSEFEHEEIRNLFIYKKDLIFTDNKYVKNFSRMGKCKWSINMGTKIEALIIKNNIGYIVNDCGSVYELNLDSIRKRLRLELPDITISEARINKNLMFISGCLSYDQNGTRGSNDEDILYAFDLKQGKKMWELKTNISSSITATDKYLYYFTGDNRDVLIINQLDGKIKMKLIVGGRIEFTENGYVIYLDKDFFLHCIKIEDKKEKWIIKNMKVLGFEINRNEVYAVTVNKELISINISTGKTIFNLKNVNPKSQVLFSQLATNNNLVYYFSDKNNLQCMNSDKKQQLWSFGNKIWTGWGNNNLIYDIDVIDGISYLISIDGCLYAIDNNLGKLLWRYPTCR